MAKKPIPPTCPSDIAADFRSRWTTIAETDGPEVATRRILKLQQELDIPFDVEATKPKVPSKPILPVSSHEALIRLSKDRKPLTGVVRQTWTSGTKPGELRIDTFIENALSSRSPHARRLKERIRAGTVECPYYAARLGLHLAVCLAEMSAPTEASIAEGKRYLKRKQGEGKKALAAIEAFVSDLTSHAFAPMARRRSSRPDLNALNSALSDAAAAADVCRATPQAIAKLIELAGQERGRLASEPNANHWARGFTEGMGRLWMDIFGEEPTRKSKAFVKFATEAYASIVDDAGPWDWETQAKDVIDKVSKRDPWDRFKRHFDETFPGEFDPPGITFSQPKVYAITRARSAKPK